MMNDFTKEEGRILKALLNPKLDFNIIQNELDKKARELGFLDREDFLVKTGWKGRFCKHE